MTVTKSAGPAEVRWVRHKLEQSVTSRTCAWCRRYVVGPQFMEHEGEFLEAVDLETQSWPPQGQIIPAPDSASPDDVQRCIDVAELPSR